MRPAAPVLMWAAIVTNARSEWIHTGTIARTRRDARATYLSMWDFEYHKKALKRVRFARVVVSLAETGATP